MRRTWIPWLAGVVMLGACTHPRRVRPPVTQTSPVSPTGELVPRGAVEQQQFGAILFHETAVGVADGVELRLGSPGLPVPVMGGDLQLRVAALPETSRWRVVVGGGVVAEWVNGADLWTGASTTVGWRGDGIGAHATVRAIHHEGEGGEVVALATAGLTLQVGKALLFVDAGRLDWRTPSTCAVETRHMGEQLVGCTDVWRGDGVMFGAWFEAKEMRFGVSAAVLRHGDTVIPVVPLLNVARYY